MTGRSAARARVGEALTIHLASFRRDGQLGETESEGHDRNRGQFISNTLESPMSLGLPVSNWRYAGVPVPNSRPAPLAPEQETTMPSGVRSGETRTRTGGHHDFQDSARKSLTGRNPCSEAGYGAPVPNGGSSLFAGFPHRIGYSNGREYPMGDGACPLSPPGVEDRRSVCMSGSALLVERAPCSASSRAMERRRGRWRSSARTVEIRLDVMPEPFSSQRCQLWPVSRTSP
jgi:hypothetical protein